jgi:ABC-type transport system substrate-binding protein
MARRAEHRQAEPREELMGLRTIGCGWVVAAIVACGAGSALAAEPTPTSGGEAVFGLEADWHPMDPLRADAVDDADVDYAIYDTLLKVTPGGELKPGLATGYTVSQDGLTYELTLRPGLKFQDGTPLDAAAVKFNLDRELDPKNDCWCRAFISSIHSVDAKDKEHVVLHLAKPYAPLPYTLASIFGGLVASPTAIQKYGKDYGNHPVGAGPFRFVSQQTGNYVTVERWDGYWEKGYPHLDKVTFRAIPDAQARYSSLLSGSIQSDENAAFRQVVAAKANPKVHVQSIPALGTIFVMFEVQKPPFDKVEARRAVGYATNFAVLNKGLFHGLYTPVQSPFPSGSWAHQPSVPGYPAYDLAKARELIKKMGGLSFTLSVQNSPEQLQLAEALQSEWKQAGLKVTIKQEDQVTLINDAHTAGYQAALYRYKGSFDPGLNVSPFFGCNASFNHVNLCDKDLDVLMQQGLAEQDKTKRLAIYHKVDARLAELFPYDFLYEADWWRLHSPKLHGIPPMPDNTLDLSHAWLEK